MKKFVLKILRVASMLMLVTFVPTITINYILDPYGLFGEIDDNYRSEPNLRTLKCWHVKSEREKYRNFLFSNSRGGVYDINSQTYYNMSYSMGVPSEFKEDIEDFINSGVKIDSVVIMLDEFAIYNNAKNHGSNPLRNKFSKEDKIAPLLLPFSWRKIESIQSFDKDNKHIKFHLSQNGIFEYCNFSTSRTIDTVNVAQVRVNSSARTMNALSEIKQLTSLLQRNGIKYILGVHPVSKTNYDKNSSRMHQLQNLLDSLDSYDINVMNNFVVLNNLDESSCFYDGSHYTPFVARHVLDKLFCR